MIGGGGEKKTLRLVAQYADACNVFGSPEAIARKYAILAEHCADVGRDPTTRSSTRRSRTSVSPRASPRTGAGRRPLRGALRMRAPSTSSSASTTSRPAMDRARRPRHRPGAARLGRDTDPAYPPGYGNVLRYRHD